jgi:hypothetical protein
MFLFSVISRPALGPSQWVPEAPSPRVEQQGRNSREEDKWLVPPPCRRPWPLGVDYCPKKKQEVLGRTNRLLTLIRHGSQRKRRVQQWFYSCVCNHSHCNVFAEPLPSNETGNIHMDTGSSCHDIHIKYQKDCLKMYLKKYEKQSLSQAVEVHRVVRRRGFHIF